eukprot:gnl/TRDRNA2_/TRDRNA2_135394_c0_seq1.p1 gnl/TRDRNA2_/TRDRNA2_135394_c0~~gnl/TRDRNA2_/TRDRNA2_135394_c0_seq1.p1  ORF type:complete len:565 (-),score=118.17 gnl/TRDRNA2_/TRDRNA2_135394_c0_seq1:129-1823(-)
MLSADLRLHPEHADKADDILSSSESRFGSRSRSPPRRQPDARPKSPLPMPKKAPRGSKRAAPQLQEQSVGSLWTPDKVSAPHVQAATASSSPLCVEEVASSEHDSLKSSAALRDAKKKLQGSWQSRRAKDVYTVEGMQITTPRGIQDLKWNKEKLRLEFCKFYVDHWHGPPSMPSKVSWKINGTDRQFTWERCADSRGAAASRTADDPVALANRFTATPRASVPASSLSRKVPQPAEAKPVYVANSVYLDSSASSSASSGGSTAKSSTDIDEDRMRKKEEQREPRLERYQKAKEKHVHADKGTQVRAKKEPFWRKQSLKPGWFKPVRREFVKQAGENAPPWRKTKMSPLRAKRISKALTRILRHIASKLGIEIRPDGFCEVKTVMDAEAMQELNCTIRELKQVVDESDKRRFELQEENGVLLIRAVQGHSIKAVKDEELHEVLDPDSDLPEECVHGTYLECIQGILKDGLLAGGPDRGRFAEFRNHVHFRPMGPEHPDAQPFMWEKFDAAIWIDLRKALQDGLPFFRSVNNIILSPGIDGCVATKYIEQVKDLRKGTLLDVPRR